MLLHVDTIYPFSLLCRTLLYKYTIADAHTRAGQQHFQLLDVTIRNIATKSRFVVLIFYEHMCAFLLYQYLGVEILSQGYAYVPT